MNDQHGGTMQGQSEPFLISEKPQQLTLPLAVASLILGFLSCVMFGVLSGVPAVICGHISLSKIKTDPISYAGKRLAIAGITLGYIGILLTIGLILALFMIYSDPEHFWSIL